MRCAAEPRTISEHPCYWTYHRDDCHWPGWPCISTVGYADPALAWLHLRTAASLKPGYQAAPADPAEAWRDRFVAAAGVVASS